MFVRCFGGGHICNLTYTRNLHKQEPTTPVYPKPFRSHLVAVTESQTIRQLQFVDLEPDSLGGRLNLEGLDGWMTDCLGDPVGQVLINGSEHAH